MKPKQTPKLEYPLCLAGSHQGPVLAEDAILLDKIRAVLWHNCITIKKYIWQKEKNTLKNQ